MTTLHLICQLIIGLGILNVWLLRFNRPTAYRGKGAQSLKEEFAAYGLPPWAVWVVGIVKVGAAVALLIGILIPQIVVPAAIVMAALMLGAILMHLKVKDAPAKSLPAATLLVLSLVLIFTQG